MERDDLHREVYLSEPGSYAPLARVDQVEGEGQKVYYFHTGQVGTPLELTDRDGTIVKGSILIVKSILTIILFFIMVLKLRCSLLRNQLGLKAVVIFINMGRNPLGVLIR